MCGIVGFTCFQGGATPDETTLRQMAATLRHRGPDAEGFHLEPGIALGHRRLSILDIAGGAQPMAVRAGRYWIACNGELFNYLELHRTLVAKGCAFATRSDTEVLLQQVVEQGVAGLDEVNGMFALAIWDREALELVLIRDRFGIKPLYCFVDRGDVVFATETKALLRHPAASREVDPVAIGKYLAYGYVPAPQTVFRRIRKLEAGTLLRATRRGIAVAKYWDVPLQDRPVNSLRADACAAELLHLLRDAVAKQMRSDVPVGVFLSGGLDSSVVAALAAAGGGRSLPTFSIGFEDATYNELPHARRVAAQYGTDHHEEVLSLERAVRLLPECLAGLDEPCGDASILPTYLLAQVAARHVKVALSGDGGDELFAGYPAFQADKLVEALSFLPVSWREAFDRAVRRLPVSHRYASAAFLLDQFIRGSGISPEVRFLLWLGPSGNEERTRLLAPALRDAYPERDPFEDVRRHVRASGLNDRFARLLYLGMKLYLQDGILAKVDRAAMAHSLEVRPPFLDHRVVAYVAGVQSMYKLKGLTTKYLLKRAARGLLPPDIIHRRKAGFMMPIASWLAGELRPLVEEHCAASVLARDGWFDPAAARQLLDEHVARRRDHRKLLWALLCFQIWRRQFGP